MKTGHKAKGSPSENLKANNKIDRSAARSNDSRTEKKRTRPSSIQFANIIEKIHEGFAALDAQMNYVYLNQRGSELLKRKPEDLIGKNYWDEYPQDKDTSFGQAYLRALENQTPITLEDYYAPRDRWFENRIYPSEAGLSIFFNDITDRKRAEGSLSESEEHLRLASQAARMCSWEMNLQDQSYKLGDNFADVIGFSAELLSKNSNEVRDMLNVSEDLPAIREILIQAVQTRSEVPPLQFRVVNPETEEIVWLEVNAQLAYDPDGKPVRMFGMMQNITGRKRKEEQLQAEEIELQEIINGTPFMLTRCSRDLRYRFVSRAYADMINRTPQEIAGKPIIDIMGPEGLNTVMPYIQQVLQGKRVEYETEVPFEGVGIPSLHVIYTPDYNEAGEVIGWFASITDITERKRTEQSLTREREMLKRLFEAMPVMVSMYDPETNSMQLNAEFERIIGWKSEEVSVVSLLEALYPDPEYRQVVLQRMAEIDRNEWVEVQVQTRDGRKLDSLWSNISIFNDQQLAAGIALGIDITERRRAEEALRDAREQAEATASRIARLQQITAVLARSATTTEFATTILEHGTQAARASAGILVSLLDNGNEIKTIAALGYPEGAVRTEPAPLSESTPISDCIQTRQAVWILSQEEFAKQYPLLAKRRGGFGLEATLALPLIAGDRVLGALAFSFVEPREFSTEEREFFLAVAQQCAQGFERARSEEILRTSEARLRLATEAAGIFAWELDLETQVYAVADNFAEVLGFSADVLPKTLRPTLQALSSEEDTQVFIEAINNAVKNRTDLRNLQYRIVNPETGQVIWLEVNAKNIYNQDGNPKRMLGVAQNITESKQTEGYIRYLNTELKARLDEMNTLMDILPIGVWIGNHDCSEITGNSAAYQMMGLTPGSNVSVTNADSDMPAGVRIFVDGEEVPPEDAPMQQVARTGKPFYNFEHELLFADGTRKGIYGSVVPLFNEQGAVRKIIGSYMDFTERKEAERRLILLTYITELLRKLEDPNELLYAISRAVGEHLRVKRCLFNEIDLENDVELVHRDYCRGVPSVAGTHKISAYNSITTNQIAAGKTIVNTDSKLDMRTAPDYERSYAPNGERAYVAVPMMREKRWVASLWVSDDTPRQWSKEEVSLLESIADRTWTVIENLRINEALRASEELYRSIARNIPNGGIYVLDKDMRYLVAEGSVTEVFGFSREMLEGHTVAEIFGPEQNGGLAENLRHAFAGQTLSSETQRDGRVYWSQYAPLIDSIGQAIIVTLDITERKQMEDALRRSEERFAKFMQYLPGLAWIKDVQGRYIYANDAAEKAFSTPRENLYGKTDHEVFAPEIAAQFQRNDELALLDGISVQLIETLEQADGILHYSLVNKFPIPSPDGNIALIGGTAFDITERRQAEEALRESEKRYRNLFELVPIAVYTCDANGLIQEFNNHAVKLWGREPRVNDPSEKFCGSFKLYYPDGQFMPNEESPMARILSGATLEQSELEIIVQQPDGIQRNVIVTSLPLKNERGEIMEGINCLYDITERKHAEEALRQLNLELESRVERRTVQLQRANQALEESRKRLQILSQRLVEVQEEERRAIARELHDRVGQSLAALSLNLTIIGNQLLNQANEQVNTRLLDSTHLVKEVIALVRDVMANLRPAVLDDYGLEVALQANLDQLKARYGISILFEKTNSPLPRLRPSVEMTILRITQEALLNIVRHAHADLAALSLQVEEETIRLTIRDNGVGIKSWQDANRPGSHGLMIMRERAEAVGGNLRISSQPGKGTEIEISIPFQQRTQKEQH